MERSASGAPPVTVRPVPAPSGDDARDPGLFGPGSVTWRIHGDPAFSVGGLRALLLQALHPRAMAAVAQQGGFAADYWGRLTRTTEYLAAITWGSTRDAERAGARVRGIHRRLRATDPFTGEEFRVDEPDLLLWVHCTEVDSLLDAARRGGVRLDPGDADRYLAEQVRAAELVGLPAGDVPATEAALADYFAEVRPRLHLLPEAEQGARVLLVPPMARWVEFLTPARPAWGGLAALAFGLLPQWARRMYRLPGLGLTDVAATAALRAVRRGALVLPAGLREGPVIREAKARLADDPAA
ncbi:oxygenase MpaB family protein [Nakamurella endophytica]|uniref:ER-bound oxygenase mpaB/mpaB'/Rubber oxygenase catalytic domain-containing protein n=1 Tax=Nakamurella endophytica TaxID=1748367 RepID=A0A917WHM7_9ACTN|nr:oxygenase MpaB family protein [Nakamurella endophytica]GGM05678.1 hypothetical protein GCM10011594_27380 [Nakamurella endophytica]